MCCGEQEGHDLGEHCRGCLPNVPRCRFSAATIVSCGRLAPSWLVAYSTCNRSPYLPHGAWGKDASVLLCNSGYHTTTKYAQKMCPSVSHRDCSFLFQLARWCPVTTQRLSRVPALACSCNTGYRDVHLASSNYRERRQRPAPLSAKTRVTSYVSERRVPRCFWLTRYNTPTQTKHTEVALGLPFRQLRLAEQDNNSFVQTRGHCSQSLRR